MGRGTCRAVIILLRSEPPSLVQNRCRVRSAICFRSAAGARMQASPRSTRRRIDPAPRGLPHDGETRAVLCGRTSLRGGWSRAFLVRKQAARSCPGWHLTTRPAAPPPACTEEILPDALDDSGDEAPSGPAQDPPSASSSRAPPPPRQTPSRGLLPSSRLQSQQAPGAQAPSPPAAGRRAEPRLVLPDSDSDSADVRRSSPAASPPLLPDPPAARNRHTN